MKACQAVTVAIIGLVVTVSVRAEGQCAVKETLIFNCELAKSTSSLCKSTENGVLTYRNRSDGKINLQISDKKRRKNVFYFSNTPYAGGGEAHIRFSRLGYTYYLYDRTIKADEGPASSAGIVVYKGEERISSLMCSNDASIHEEAYQAITREKYRSIDVRQDK
ncbi:TPA: hypothetical protein QDA94_000302 [Burkholderia vietnamiensis]|nr:hypothetical protein [Burkholderia vietnamiensis]HDR9231263.1 hypothetical protein [Burkholderia vietnamiensis]